MEQQNGKKTIKTTIIGYAAAIGVSVTTVMTIPSGQMLGDRIPPFESNFFRFTLQLIISSFIIVIRGKDPRVSGIKVIAVLCVSTAATFSAGVFFIVSSWYLPAAVVDGILENVIIVLASIAAIFIKHCNIVLPVAVITSLVGNLLLFQPPLIFHHLTSFTDVNITELNCTTVTWCNQTANETIQNCTICEEVELSNASSSTLLGFIFSVLLGFSFWIHEQINVPFLIQHTNVDVIFFWTSAGCFPFAAGGLFFTSTFVVPTNAYDIGLLLMLCLSLIAGVYLVMISVVSISPTHTALVLPSAVAMLFILQKTVLSDIHPGPGNWMETLGLVMIIIASLSPAVYDLVQHRMQSKNKEMDERALLVPKEDITQEFEP